MNTRLILDKYLKGTRILKYVFDDLSFVAESVKTSPESKIWQILDWFRFLQKQEIVGWRPKSISRKIIKILAENNRSKKLLFYALFCPSYKKGKGVYGFRTDDVGATTKAGLKNLINFYENTVKLGFFCEKPLAIFFDIAVEQPEKVLATNGLKDLEVNIKNFQRALPKEVSFVRLSKLFPELFQQIGYKGIVLDLLPIPQKTFDRIVERGKKFYQLFGWTDKQVVERSKGIASSEALVGKYLKRSYPCGLMIYTPTMLERGAVYSGMGFETDPLPIIFPKKIEREPKTKFEGS